MTPHALKRLDRELTMFMETLTAGLGRSERRTAMGQYITGLLLDGERKSIERIAARLVDDEAQIEAMRQRLQQCVVVSAWDEATMFGRVAQTLDQELPEVTAFVVDDTGFPKKGRHSVGVARQYSGTLGRTDNCQIATSLHLAGERGSGCIGMRLYLPESWTTDQDRCRAAGVPDSVTFAPMSPYPQRKSRTPTMSGPQSESMQPPQAWKSRRPLDGRQPSLVTVGLRDPIRLWRPRCVRVTESDK